MINVKKPILFFCFILYAAVIFCNGEPPNEFKPPLSDLLKELNKIPTGYNYPKITVENESTYPAIILSSLKFDGDGEKLDPGYNIVEKMLKYEGKIENLNYHKSLHIIDKEAIKGLQDLDFGGLKELRLQDSIAIGGDTKNAPVEKTFPKQQIIIAANVARYILREIHKNADLINSPKWKELLMRPDPPDIRKLAADVEVLKKKLEEPDSKAENLNRLIYAVAALAGMLVLIGALLWRFYYKFQKHRRKIKDQANGLKSEVNSLKINNTNSQTKQSIGSSTNEKRSTQVSKSLQISQLNSEIEILKKQISELDQKVKDKGNNDRRSQGGGQSSAYAGHVQRSGNSADDSKYTDHFFAAAPINEYFYGRSLSNDFRPKEHIYKILVIDGNSADYTLTDNKESQKYAFNIPQDYIQPAMEMKGNGRLQDATKIKVEKGKLTKEGDNWRITQKAIIEYS